jgi:hypothetical protein
MQITADVNGSEFPESLFSSKLDRKEELLDDNDPEITQQATLADLFRPRTICIRTIVMFYNWLVSYFLIS